ncbi:Chitooligosaccharide deacetylase [uncultured Gammaproteobacteria bacterium]
MFFRLLRRWAVTVGIASALVMATAAVPVRLSAADLISPDTIVSSAGASSASGGVVVFAYNRFGEDRTPSTSIRLDQFEEHLDELRNGGYAVQPLSKIIEQLAAGVVLPDRTVAITIDEASRSAFREAWPRLRHAGIPFTLFVAADAIDRATDNTMTWADIRDLYNNGVTIGALSASGRPMGIRDRQDLINDLHREEERFQAELGFKPALFAYPFGEYSLEARTLVEKRGYAAAFGLQSGVAHARADRYALPRFVMNESFGGIDRFILAANALPLPVTDLTPADPVLTTNPPHLGFTLPEGIRHPERLACFATGQGRTVVERLDTNRIEVRLADPLPPGRPRINCTLPADDGRWHWFGVQFLVPSERH